MTKDQREIQRKLWILRYAEEIDHVAKMDLEDKNAYFVNFMQKISLTLELISMDESLSESGNRRRAMARLRNGICSHSKLMVIIPSFGMNLTSKLRCWQRLFYLRNGARPTSCRRNRQSQTIKSGKRTQTRKRQLEVGIL